MRKTTLTISVLSALLPVSGAIASIDVKPFAPSLAQSASPRSMVSQPLSQGRSDSNLMVSDVKDAIGGQIKTRVETGEFGENDRGEPEHKGGEDFDKIEEGDEKGDDDKNDNGSDDDKNDDKDGDKNDNGGDDDKNDDSEKGETHDKGSS